jgi:hypothetical protein
MRIAEMEEHHDEFTALQHKIKTMVANRKFPAVFADCLASFPHIVPAIKYRKRKGITPEMPALQSFSVICKYAPPLFEYFFIESLSAFVGSTRLLAKHDNDYCQTINGALQRIEIARALWNRLEQQPGVLQRDIFPEILGNRAAIVEILDVWEQLGVIIRRQEQDTYTLCLRSRFDVEAEGVCQACGVHGKGRKELFFKIISCQKCGAKGYYHLKYTDPQ